MHCEDFLSIINHPFELFNNFKSLFTGKPEKTPADTICSTTETICLNNENKCDIKNNEKMCIAKNDDHPEKNNDQISKKELTIGEIINICNGIDGRIVDIKHFFCTINMKLKYCRSNSTSHIFKTVSANNVVRFMVKITPHEKNSKYGSLSNLSRPQNVERLIWNLLNELCINKYTPHIVTHYVTFNTNITNFIKIPKKIIDLDLEKNEMYAKFVKNYHECKLEDFVTVSMGEWCNGGDLLDYIKKNYVTMTLRDWIVIFFQILFTLAVIHKKYPTFRHNDMKANNILVQLTDIKTEPNSRYKYNIDDIIFYVPNINVQIKIWDFDFASIDGIIENNKVNSDWAKCMNITKTQNKYYDMHYFFNTLISKRFFPQFYEGAPLEIIEFVHRIIPEKYRNKNDLVNNKGRILVDDEYTTPYKVITEDPLFEKYRFVL